MQDKISIGILAHVDAGKTTLAEALLYIGGQIRNLGRVDHKDAFLDHFSMERDRGITIFSKQANFSWRDLSITLLDTPGHVDFSAEMERTLQVMDYAILLINGADGVQGHTRTLWDLLRRYGVPTFLFVNKMDQQGTNQDFLLRQLQRELNTSCVCFNQKPEELSDALSMCSEELMEEYLETEHLRESSIQDAILERKVFPVYFGSALRLKGVEDLLNGLYTYHVPFEYPTEGFGARVFKITRDNNNNRITHMKITSGSLKAKQMITNEGSAEPGEEIWSEKVDRIRLYNGNSFTHVEEAFPGDICGVLGLTQTFIGQGLGVEQENEKPILEPLMTYCLLLGPEYDPVIVYGQMKILEEEDPLLRVVWKESLKEIHVQVMGQVQIEVLKSEMESRFGIRAEFGSGSIVYKETVAEPTVGIGHFEPLRHYAEVHLLIEPGERGSGVMVGSGCSVDVLDKNWQRLIITHVTERAHVGVLAGGELTDVRITLLTGRAHNKHTEGGDFRQATYRAIRQGLMHTKSVLLEPHFAFKLEVPEENIGRAMSDIQRMKGSFSSPIAVAGRMVLSGKAPVAAMQDYAGEVKAYTKGEGNLSCTFAGYEPCGNEEEVLAQIGYDPELDLANPASSVFCAHGAGFVVPWNQVESYAHVESEEKQEETTRRQLEAAKRKSVSDYISQDEIDAIYAQTFGKNKQDNTRYRRYHVSHKKVEQFGADSGTVRKSREEPQKENCLLVDGYNIIFAWPELKELATRNLDSARDKLMDIMSNYQGMIGGQLILVFDAYKVKGNPGSLLAYHNIHVVFTKEAQTADQYIEKTVHEMAKKFRITVATSDALEQMIVWGDGAMRMSALGLLDEVKKSSEKLRSDYGITTQ